MGRRSRVGGWAVVVALGLGGSSWADDPPLDLAEVRATLANPAIPADERARRALDAAGTLDQAAQQAATASDRRARWDEAIGLLDGFLARNPTVEAAPLIGFQAGVYAWAAGRSFADQAELAPADAPARAGAIRGLDEATRRLRGVAVKPGDAADPFAENLRFRTAQAIADRARFEPEGTAGRLASEREALGLLDRTAAAPGLRGFSRLLRAELATRLGLYGEAQIEVEEAEKSTPPPPPASILEARVASLIGRQRFEEAREAVAASRVEASWKGLLTVRIGLGRRRETSAGRLRDEVDAESFRAVEALRAAGGAEARRALIELARGVDEPPRSAPPGWWDLLAEGQLRLGNAPRAGRLAAQGADRAEAQGQAEQAATLRFRAGAYLFEAEKYAEADGWLSRVAESTAAPAALRARSGMLRTLARGRALATRQPGASKEAYLKALEGQVRDFAADPASAEARWLLGKVRVAAGRPSEAVALWSGIAHGQPRWLEARLAIDDLLFEGVADQRINRDSAATRSKMEQARRSLRDALAAATDGGEAVPLELRSIRLELTPEVGRPPDALAAADRTLKGAARPDQHRQARLGRMVALAASNRFVEAEAIARAEVKGDDPAPLLVAARLLDRSAGESEAESGRRRLGLILKILTGRLVDRPDQLAGPDRDEARLRHARALLFAGDPDAARREVAAWGGPASVDDPALLRDLADAYLRLDAFGLAVDAERLRLARLNPGSLPWLEARYGLALASYRGGRAKDARQVVDATAILHPDLGGGELRVKFERLRQRMGQE